MAIFAKFQSSNPNPLSSFHIQKPLNLHIAHRKNPRHHGAHGTLCEGSELFRCGFPRCRNAGAKNRDGEWAEALFGMLGKLSVKIKIYSKDGDKVVKIDG